MAEEPSSIEIQIALIQHDLAEIKTIVVENRDAIVGRADCPGILTQMALQNNRMEGLETLTNNHLAHIKERLDSEFVSRDKLQSIKDSGQVSWKEIIKDWAKPVITALVTALAIALLSQAGLI